MNHFTYEVIARDHIADLRREVGGPRPGVDRPETTGHVPRRWTGVADALRRHAKGLLANATTAEALDRAETP